MNTESFEKHRPRLFGVAYRMLGSAREAEDVVQDAWLRYSAADRQDVRSPEAFLTTIVTRLCLDRLKSARAKREEYIGPWLPEPVITDAHPGPEQSAALAESVTLAFMVLLETLSPEERATFLLREVFEYEYRDVADVLNTAEANCRQMFHRAKSRLQERRPRYRQAAADKRELVGRFATALRDGDAAMLRSVLAEDVGLWSDGGGRVSAARRPLFGRDTIVHFLMGIRRVAVSLGVNLSSGRIRDVDVNGEPAIAIQAEGRIDSIYTFSFENGAITALRIGRNPDKLGDVARQLQ